MKLGAENKKKMFILAGMGVLALVLLVRTFFSGDDSGPAPVAVASPTAALNGAAATANAAGSPSTATVPKTTANLHGKRPKPIPNPLDPRLHLDQLQGTEGVSYEGSGRNIFAAEAEIPQVVKSPRITKKDQERQAEIARNTPPPIPQPPPITLKFFGFASKAGEPKKIFLSQGEDIFIASEGDVVSRRYRVVKIGPNSVDIEDTLTKHTQSIPLTIT